MPVQIIIFIGEDGQLRAEAPSTNGARKKIDLTGYSLSNLPTPLIAEVLDQRDRLASQAEAKKEAEKAANLALKRSVWTNTMRAHGLALADKVVVGGSRMFARSATPGKPSVAMMRAEDLKF